MSEWDLLMPQADLTLNLLRPSCRYPQLSVHTCLNQSFDFLSTLLAPPVTRIIDQITPSQRANMAPHGTDGWYVGPSLNHYRCHKCFIPTTSRCWDVLTLDWFPHTVPFPTVTANDYLKQTADDMLSLLQAKTTKASPLAFGSPITNAFIQVAQILRRAAVPPTQCLLPAIAANEMRVELAAPPAPPPTPIPGVPELRVVSEPVPPPAGTTKKRPAPLPPRKSAPPNRPTPHRPGTSCLYARQYVTRYGRAIQHLVQSACLIPKYAHHIAALGASAPITGKQASLTKLLRGPDATMWSRSHANKWGRLLEFGIGQNCPASERIAGTGTIFFVKKTDVPANRHVSYANYVCNIRPQKTETHRVRMTAGGDRLDYPGDASSPAVSILDAHKGARYFGIDLKNFYLGTPMTNYQYISVLQKMIPKEVWDDPRYTIHISADGFVYLEIRRGMYGLKEAGVLAFEQLARHLAPHGYEPAPYTPGLFRHAT